MFFLILKIILMFLVFLLLIVAAILFIPFQLTLQAAKKDNHLRLKGSAYWISWLFKTRVEYSDQKIKIFAVVLGIPIKIPLKKIKKGEAKDKDKVKSEEKSEEKKETIGIKPEREAEDKKTSIGSDQSPGEKGHQTGGSSSVETEKGGIKDTIGFYQPFIRKTLIPQIRRLFSYFHLRIRRFQLVYGHENPAVTGWVEGAVVSSIPFLAAKRMSDPVSTRFRYDKKALDFNVDLYFSMNLFGIVIRLLIIWWHYRRLSSLQRRIKHEPDAGKTS